MFRVVHWDKTCCGSRRLLCSVIQGNDDTVYFITLILILIPMTCFVDCLHTVRKPVSSAMLNKQLLYHINILLFFSADYYIFQQLMQFGLGDTASKDEYKG